MLGPLVRAASAMPSAFRSIVTNGLTLIGQGFTRLGTFFRNGAASIARIGYENLFSAIQQATQYTMPKDWMQAAGEQPSSDQLPTHETKNKTWGRRIADAAFFPFTTLPGWISGFSIIPIVMHSYDSFLSFLQTPTQILYADRKPEAVQVPKLHGLGFGLLGAGTGLIAGAFIALFFLGIRMIEQTWEVTAVIWTRLVNWSVQDIDVEKNQALVGKLKVEEKAFNQTLFETFLGVFPLGWLAIFVSGGITLGVIGAGRFVLNTLVSMWHNFSSGVNLAVYDMYTDDTLQERMQLIPHEDKRNMIQRFFFGWMGESLGLGLGSVGFVVVGLGRVLINSVESFVRLLFLAMQLPLQESILYSHFDLPDDERGKKLSYGFSEQLGYPGQYVLGGGAIVLGGLLGGVLRFINETIISAVNAGNESLNLVLAGVKNYQPGSPLQATRKPYERVIGVLGYPLGAVILLPVTIPIAITRYVITNLDTIQKVIRFFTVAESSLHGPTVVQASSPQNTSDAQAAPAALDVNLPPAVELDAQAVTAEHPWFQQASDWIQNVFEKDGRPVFLQLLSFPGAVVGTVIGGGWRLIIETTLNSFDSASALLKLALYKSKFKDAFQPIKPNRNTLEIILGSPGYLTGFGLAIVPAVIIDVVRWIITNGETAHRTFIATANRMRIEHDHLPRLGVDTRPKVVRYSTVLGAAVGVLLGLGREISYYNIQSFSRQVRYLSKKSLFESAYEANIDALTDDTRLLSQQRLGYPGLALGTFVGSIGAGGMTCARVVGNTLITGYHTIRDMIDFVFLDDYPISDTFAESRRIVAYLNGEDRTVQDAPVSVIELIHVVAATDPPVATPVSSMVPPSAARREDKRKRYPFLLGSPGFLFGGSIGLVSALIAGSGRIAWQSLIMAYNTTLDFADAMLPENMATTDHRIKQAPVPKLLGYPLGKLFGAVMGAVAWSGIFVSRFVINTALSAVLVAQMITLAPPMGNKLPKLNDPRGWETFDRKIGVLGYILGVPFGLVGFVGNYILHIIYHSVISAYRALFFTAFWTVGSTRAKFLLGVDQAFFERAFGSDNRTPFQRYVFGFLGVIGVAIGSVIASVIALVRLTALNVRLFEMGFKQAANLTLEKPYTEASMKLDHTVNKIQLGQEITLNDTQLDDLKYTFGFVGFAFGGVIGAMVVAVPVGVGRWLKESVKSYYHLSQSLLNVGLEAPYFEHGVATDARASKLKVLGGLGYLGAVVTTGLIPVLSLLGKGVLISIAVMFFPLVGLIKYVRIQYSPRFKKLVPGVLDENPAEGKMRSLYSSLVDGELPDSKDAIQSPANGSKGVGDFFRKSFLFNTNSLTEDILQEKLNAIREQNNGQACVLAPEVKNRIKRDHHGPFFFTAAARKQYDERVDQEVDAIVQFVDAHVDGNNPDIPVKENRQLSPMDLFNYKLG